MAQRDRDSAQEGGGLRRFRASGSKLLEGSVRNGTGFGGWIIVIIVSLCKDYKGIRLLISQAHISELLKI